MAFSEPAENIKHLDLKEGMKVADFGAGSGFSAFSEILQSRYSGQLIGMDGNALPMAENIAALGALQFSRGLGVDAALAQPFYLRDKVALKTSEREQMALDKPGK